MVDGRGGGSPAQLSHLEPRNEPIDTQSVGKARKYRLLYISAGYTTNAKSAGVQAHRLVNKPKMRAEISRRQAEFMQRYEVTQERIIAEFAKLAFSNIADFTQVMADGSLKIDFSAAKREQLAAVASVDEIVDSEGNRFRVHDKKGALTELACLGALMEA